MNRSEELITVALKSLPPKPADAAPQGEKKRYSELMSQVLAAALAEELLIHKRQSPKSGQKDLSNLQGASTAKNT